MALCKTCAAKVKPTAAYNAKCEICYQEFEATIPGAVVCDLCSEQSDFCQICKESIAEY